MGINPPKARSVFGGLPIDVCENMNGNREFAMCKEVMECMLRLGGRNEQTEMLERLEEFSFRNRVFTGLIKSGKLPHLRKESFVGALD